MSATNYAAMSGINWSALKYLATSPLLYRWRCDHPQKSTSAMVIGAAIHCATLEPEHFDERYAVYDDTRRGKAWDAFREDHPGVLTFKSRELVDILAAAVAVRGHAVASRLLDGGRVEEPLRWVDPDTGLECKGRVDFIAPAGVVDLKSCADPAPRVFAAQAARLLYHGQLAWYHHGAITARLIPADAAPPRCIAVQSEEPYDVACYQLSTGELDAGRALCIELQDLLGACIAADYWPGVAPELMPLQLPRWTRGLATGEEEGF